jgi:hypothetical protein
MFRTPAQINARKQAKKARQHQGYLTWKQQKEDEDAAIVAKYADKIARDEKEREVTRFLIEQHEKYHPGEPFHETGYYGGVRKTRRKKSKKTRKTRRKTYRRQ